MGSGKMSSMCCTFLVQGNFRLFGLLYATLRDKKTEQNCENWAFSQHFTNMVLLCAKAHIHESRVWVAAGTHGSHR